MTLPAGYVDLDGVAVHVAKLRNYTTDVRRFMRCYPVCQALEQHPPGSEPWRDIVRGLTDEDRQGVAVTLREAGALFMALSADLERDDDPRPAA
jgi:hypothetical protein